MNLGKAVVGTLVLSACQVSYAHETPIHVAECAKAHNRNFSAIRFADAVASPEAPVSQATRQSIEMACIFLMTGRDREQASARLVQIFSQSTKAGQLYALSALYGADKSTFDALAKDLDKDQARIDYVVGDVVSERSVADLVQAIRDGQLPKIFADFTERWTHSTDWTSNRAAGLR